MEVVVIGAERMTSDRKLCFCCYSCWCFWERDFQIRPETIYPCCYCYYFRYDVQAALIMLM